MRNGIQTRVGTELRHLARSGVFGGQTAGQAPNFLQGNVVILPLKHAADFLLFCKNNPKPCPLIGLTKPGNPSLSGLGTDIDIRTDVPRYRIYKNGALSEEVNDIRDLWHDQQVAFVLGCSFTFEEALLREGYEVRHIANGSNVPMFKTNIATVPGGIFSGPMVVTMRPFCKEQIAEVFDLSARYPHAHGAPIYWGDPSEIGIKDLSNPDYGDPVEVLADEVPVFWACGVTPQAAIEAAKPELCITHAPGHMLVTDIPSDQTPTLTAGMVVIKTAHQSSQPEGRSQ